MTSPYCRRVLATVLFLSLAGSAQQSAAPPPAQAAPDAESGIVQKQFGANCTPAANGGPFVGDLDGDGIADAVFVARCKNPLMDQAENNFQVLDPYHAFFGFGDPKITSEFATQDPQRRDFAILIIHGAGPEAWRSAVPKAKFIIINLPFRQVSVKRLQLRKKKVMAIYVEESFGQEAVSALYWDGKKYKYQPMGSTME